MTSLIVWCVGLIVVVFTTVALAEGKYGFDEKRGRITKRGEGDQYDRFSEAIIEFVVMIHMATTLIASAVCGSRLFELIDSVKSEAWLLYPLLGCAYLLILCLVCISLFGAIKRAKRRRMLEKKRQFKNAA